MENTVLKLKNYDISHNEELDNKSTMVLDRSMKQISNSAVNVMDISAENESAIGIIIEKSEVTSQISDDICRISSENMELSRKLKDIIVKFKK